MDGTVESHAFLGSATRIEVMCHGLIIKVLIPKGGEVPAVGDTVKLGWPNSALHLMEGANG